MINSNNLDNFKTIKSGVIAAACLISTFKFLNYTDLCFNSFKDNIKSLINNWSKDARKEKIVKLLLLPILISLGAISLSTALIFSIPAFYYSDKTFKLMFRNIAPRYPKPVSIFYLSLKDKIPWLFSSI